MFQICLLGEQVISDATGTLRTRSSRSVTLVAYLVVHATLPQTRQRIAALFWPDSADEQALTNLRRELHHLRGVLGDEPSLVVTARDLCWQDAPSCRVDVRVFTGEHDAALAAAATGDDAGVLTHAAAAVDAYRGEFLPGGYDDWLLEARAELEGRCVDVLDLLAETRARTGDLAGAVADGRRRTNLRPLDEAGYRRLMQWQGDAGDRAGAVSTFHRCASVLERELGVEPDPSTRAALDQLLARVGPAVTPEPETPPATRRPGLAAAPLVGRHGEFEMLRRVWTDAAAGRPRLALVRGDPGVGKSRLVTEVAELARTQGAVVATAQCFGTSGRLALSPVADWLRSPAVQTAAASLDPVWRTEVERLVPTTRGRNEPGGARTMAEAWQRHRFFEGLARALIGAGRPTLLVLDNLQWCDQETRAFLAFYLGLSPDTPVMVAATLRAANPDDEPGLEEWTARMRGTSLLSEVPLRPLDGPDTARLAEEFSGRALTTTEQDLLQATTGGFPLYVVEAARGGTGNGPLPIGDLGVVLSRRLDQVSADARDLAGLAAAVGRNFTLDLLTEASDLDADCVVRAVDELWRARIIQEIDDGYDFSHDLLRDAAYEQVSPPKRWLLHRRVAQGLELLHADDTDAVSAELAEQYAHGGRAGRAVEYYGRAAAVAADRFAHAEAIRLDKEVLATLATWPDGRDRRTRELATLEAMAAPLNARFGYSSPELREVLERSVEVAESLGRRDSTVTGLVGLWGSYFVQGDIAGGHRIATRALALVESEADADPSLSGRAHFAVGGSEVSLGRLGSGLSHLEYGVGHGEGPPLSIGSRTDVHGRAFAAHAHWLLGHDDEALANAREAIALARRVDSTYNVAVALAYGAVTHQLGRRPAELADTVGELRELCDRYDFAYYREWAMVLSGWQRGDQAGLNLARRGVDTLTATDSFSRMPYWLSLIADLNVRLGQDEAARAALDAAMISARSREDLWWGPEVMRMRAAFDDGPAAVTRLRSAAELASSQGSVALLRRCEHDLLERGVTAERAVFTRTVEP
ncbi:AAA family ATPase [Actinomycetospora endophytica]|uniref:AAA family ATPase n=1 Tax=Actinomycetospora endophytica TaxID=2291215 RepID=A0ABS8PBK2_9PSEU|nr:AAA family ATPase [Actinomycetospora endophytica]MCD2195373.1 AAA family ATPase [Actinomycetospora endophytica]